MRKFIVFFLVILLFGCEYYPDAISVQYQIKIVNDTSFDIDIETSNLSMLTILSGTESLTFTINYFYFEDESSYQKEIVYVAESGRPLLSRGSFVARPNGNYVLTIYYDSFSCECKFILEDL